MINILADQHHYTVPPQDALVATSIDDYVVIRQRIRQALDHHDDLTIYVADLMLLRWLSDMQDYPSRVVQWRDLNPLVAFANRFGVEAGPPFTPELIIMLKLETLQAIPPGVIVEPVSWILGERLGVLWRYIVPPTGHAAQLAAWAAQQHGEIDPVLHPLIETQLARWSEHDPIYCAFHANYLHQDGVNLLTRYALQRYDMQWRNMQPWGQLPLLDASGEGAACIEVLRREQTAINGYWQQRFAAMNQSADLIPIALHQMSGLSHAEVSALRIMLERHPTQVTEPLVTLVQQRFSQLPHIDDILEELRVRVVPPKPTLPDPHWSTGQWLHWATRMYIPYFAWIVRYEQDRQHQQACARHFSDWLYRQYPSWLNDDQAPLLLRQYQKFRALLDDDSNAVVVWLVVDGLTWWQGRLLRAACERYGLHAQSDEAGIAVLPSITSVSKRALVTGIPSTREARERIAEAARAKLQLLGIKGHVSYHLPAAVQIAQQREDTRCLIVFFNTLDVLAHQTQGFTDNAGIRGYINDLAVGLHQIRSAYEQQGRSLHVLIGSDHGSTLLPSEARSVALPQSSQAIDDTWEPETTQQETQKPSARAAETLYPERLEAKDHSAWYVLNHEEFQLDRHYLVPRGYNYVGRRPSGWTHGGLTPEEVIVPMMHFTLKSQERLPLTVEFMGSLRAYQPTTLTAVIVNANRFPVDMLILDIGRGTTPVQVEHLAPVSRHEVAIEFPSITDGAADTLVQWQLRYDMVSGPQMQQGQQTIAVRRLQTDDSSFDDFFTDS